MHVAAMLLLLLLWFGLGCRNRFKLLMLLWLTRGMLPFMLMLLVCWLQQLCLLPFSGSEGAQHI
jgi:hypothetical protein